MSRKCECKKTKPEEAPLVAENLMAATLVENGHLELAGATRDATRDSPTCDEFLNEKGELQRFSEVTISSASNPNYSGDIEEDRSPSEQAGSSRQGFADGASIAKLNAPTTMATRERDRREEKGEEEQNVQLDFSEVGEGSLEGKEEPSLSGLMSPRTQSPIDYDPQYSSIKDTKGNMSPVSEKLEMKVAIEDEDLELQLEVGLGCLNCLGQGFLGRLQKPIVH